MSHTPFVLWLLGAVVLIQVRTVLGLDVVQLGLRPYLSEQELELSWKVAATQVFKATHLAAQAACEGAW